MSSITTSAGATPTRLSCDSTTFPPLEGNADIAGIGTVWGFSASTIVVIGALILYYIMVFDPSDDPSSKADGALRDNPNIADREVYKRRKLIVNWFRRQLGNGIIDTLGQQRKHFVRENAFFTLVQGLNDAQTFGAIALLGSGTHAVFHLELPSYHWRVISQLAWLSAITNMVTLTITRRFLHRDSLRKGLRVFILCVLTAGAALGSYPTGDRRWTSNRPARCYYDPSFWKPRIHDFLGVEGLASEGILLYGFLIRFLRICIESSKFEPLVRWMRRTMKLKGERKNENAKWKPHKILRFASRIIQSVFGKAILYDKWPRSMKVLLDMLVMQLLVVLVIVMRTMWAAYTSVASELYWAIVAGAWGLTNIFITRDEYGSAEENQWAVGQIVPLVLLLSPLIASVDCFGTFIKSEVSTRYHEVRHKLGMSSQPRDNRGSSIESSDSNAIMSTESSRSHNSGAEDPEANHRLTPSPIPSSRPDTPSSHSIASDHSHSTINTLPAPPNVLRKKPGSPQSRLQTVESGLEVIHLPRVPYSPPPCLPYPHPPQAPTTPYNTPAYTYISTFLLHPVPQPQQRYAIESFLREFHKFPWFFFLILQISAWVSYFTFWVFSSRVECLYPIVKFGLGDSMHLAVEPRPEHKAETAGRAGKLTSETVIQVLVWGTLIFPLSLVFFVLMWYQGLYFARACAGKRRGNDNGSDRGWFTRNLGNLLALVLCVVLFGCTTFVFVFFGYEIFALVALGGAGIWIVSCFITFGFEVGRSRKDSGSDCREPDQEAQSLSQSVQENISEEAPRVPSRLQRPHPSPMGYFQLEGDNHSAAPGRPSGESLSPLLPPQTFTTPASSPGFPPESHYSHTKSHPSSHSRNTSAADDYFGHFTPYHALIHGTPASSPQRVLAKNARGKNVLSKKTPADEHA
ncbi:hypothetical protein MKZ38_000067 [Zalerion maritima]|uniref:Uncharacterized protein n=1 Tax=Zalerion maritima TaxID=339359 RepID=A0AAD5RFZ9_9PEZI|nr:hypothetical protein MKZ38_000067 [Zalerion maritima]